MPTTWKQAAEIRAPSTVSSETREATRAAISVSWSMKPFHCELVDERDRVLGTARKEHANSRWYSVRVAGMPPAFGHHQNYNPWARDLEAAAKIILRALYPAR